MLNKDLFGKIPVTPFREPVVTQVKMGETSRSYRRKPHQLQMFMRPHEIKNLVTDSVDRRRINTAEYEWAKEDHENWLEDMNLSEHDHPFEPPEAQTMEHLWEEKADESDYIVDSLHDTGGKINKPVTIQTVNWDKNGKIRPHIREFHMGQGHHRVAGAETYEAETGRAVYIPVMYDDDWGFTDSIDYRNLMRKRS